MIIGGIDYENDADTLPDVSRMEHGVYDPENRFRSSEVHHLGYPGDGRSDFRVEGAKHLRVRRLGEA